MMCSVACEMVGRCWVPGAKCSFQGLLVLKVPEPAVTAKRQITTPLC
jgi:hypothetical protein